MAYGGPSSLAEMPGYLADIRSGRPTSRAVLEEISHNYEVIGGSSPLPEISRRQVDALQARLDPALYRCYLGMRHWAPWIEEVVGEMLDDGITHAVSVVLAPHYSALSVAKYADKIAAGLDLYRGEIAFEHVHSYHDRPQLIEALSARVHDGLSRWPEGQRDRVHVVFSAHSLPVRILAAGDPYDQQLRETARLVAEHAGLGADRWSWSFQSAGRTPEPWLGPQIDDHIEAARRRRREGRDQHPRRLRLRPCRDPLRHRREGARGRRQARRAARAPARIERRPALHRHARRGHRGACRAVALGRDVNRVVVVGGGIAGLAAALRLERTSPDTEVVLVESRPRIGGTILTEEVGGFVIEGAPDSFLARKPRGIGLCEELGLTCELITRVARHRRTYVRLAGELRALPEGLTGMIPTRLEALASSGILSAGGPRPVALEPVVPASRDAGDESIADFVSRRMGREAYERLVEPLMSGIYAGDGEQLSLAATFPNLRQLEREYGSVTRGLLEGGSDSPAAGPPFPSLRGGMRDLVTGLVDRLVSTRLVTGRAVASLRRAAPWHGYVLDLADGDTLAADAVVLATPAYVTGRARRVPRRRSSQKPTRRSRMARR